MLVVLNGRVMANEIITHRDALRHTAGRSAVSVGLTVLLTLSLCLSQFGSDPDALVRAGFVTKSSIMISMIISGLLTAGLSYRSALMMRDLAVTRAELQRISGTAAGPRNSQTKRVRPA